MWGFGGRYYWGRKKGGGNREGIVVVFAWMSSQDKHLRSYVELYSSLGWNSLVCHSEFLNQFFPDKASKLAFDILIELVEDLKVRPCPVVFASFSGGPKACMYKALQIVDGKCEPQLDMGDCRMVRDCISGHIYDSSPVDFTSDLGSRFAVHPSVIKMSHPPKLAVWIANGIAYGLDGIFLNTFESQRAEYWQTLYSSVNMGAPYLIILSETDDLAPYQTIYNFALRLQELGGDVKLVKMNGSPHVGHYRIYPIDYKAVTSELLGKAAAVYSQRILGLEGERMGLVPIHGEISGPINDLSKATASPNRSFGGVHLAPNDDFLSSSSMEYDGGRDVSLMQDERKEGPIHFPSNSSPPSIINSSGVLGQILFDVCVPKNVEGWDLRSPNACRHNMRNAPFNPIKYIRRSRL